MIDWIHDDLRHWGPQKYWQWFGKRGAWPTRTMLGKIMEEGFTGAAHFESRQVFAECLDSRALRTDRIIKSLTPNHQFTIICWYVVRGSAAYKSRVLKVPYSTFKHWRNRAHDAYQQKEWQLAKNQPKGLMQSVGYNSSFAA